MAEIDPFILYRPTDPETSRGAAEMVAPHIPGLRWRVLLLLYWNPGGLPLIDVEQAFDDHGSSYRSRVPDLRKLGLAEETLYRVQRVSPGKTRPTWRVVFRISAKGRQFVEQVARGEGVI